MSDQKYFTVKNGELKKQIIDIKRKNLQIRKDFFELSKEVGADGYYTDSREELCFDGFLFDDLEKVDKTKFKGNSKNGWYPKKNTKWGKEITQRIDNIQSEVKSEIDFIQKSGLNADIGSGYKGNRSYIMFPSVQVLLFSDHSDRDNVVFVFVPEKQKEDWVVPDFLDEIREWEYLKILDEYNTLLKK